jgi:hypothetical protein
MYHVLHDFTFFVKTCGYLTALFVLCMIVPFWVYLIGGEKKRKR